MNQHVMTQHQATDSPLITGCLLQRKCACGQHTGGGECEECQKKKQTLQRKEGSGAESVGVPPIVREVLRSPGQPLDPVTRSYLEPRFGRDFSHVRVHVDTRAAESAQAVNALAYTVGRNVVFGAGQYQPQAMAGKALMAHELTNLIRAFAVECAHRHTRKKACSIDWQTVVEK